MKAMNNRAFTFQQPRVGGGISGAQLRGAARSRLNAEWDGIGSRRAPKNASFELDLTTHLTQ